MKTNKNLIQTLLNQTGIVPETELEKSIMDHPAWQAGALYGKPRRGHPEGKVIFHIAEVLENVEHMADSPETREKLRLITLIHDTFKFEVDTSKPKCGENHHARRARTFARQFIQDSSVLTVIEHHDDAYNIWRRGHFSKKWEKADRQINVLIEKLGPDLELYRKFYWCDNRTGDKDQTNFLWFESRIQEFHLNS